MEALVDAESSQKPIVPCCNRTWYILYDNQMRHGIHTLRTHMHVHNK